MSRQVGSFFTKGGIPLLLAVAIFLMAPGPASAEIRIDGRIDEAQWAEARSFDNFVVTEPWTLHAPSFPTRAKVLSLPEGLRKECGQLAPDPRRRAPSWPGIREGRENAGDGVR